jgi:hypothetical protein
MLFRLFADYPLGYFWQFAQWLMGRQSKVAHLTLRRDLGHANCCEICRFFLIVPLDIKLQ